jgi:hypothetical protein
MIRVWTIKHVIGGHLHGQGDFAPDAPFFHSKAKAEAQLVHYGDGFVVVELREVAPDILKGRDPYA